MGIHLFEAGNKQACCLSWREPSITLFLLLLLLNPSAVSDSSATPWTIARQAPLSMGFPKQEYWSGLPFPPPGDLPDPGIKPASPASPALAGGFVTTEPPGKPSSLRATATSSVPRGAGTKGTQGLAYPTHPARGVGTGDTPGRQPLPRGTAGWLMYICILESIGSHTL